MLTGRQKIEAAFSREGSREFAATVCWEDVFVRDHWDQLSASPWYDQYSPDLEDKWPGAVKRWRALGRICCLCHHSTPAKNART